MKRMSMMLMVLSVCLLSGTVLAADFYVDQSKGDDANDGSKDKPFKTLPAAMSKAKGGDNIYLQPGKYAAIDRSKNPWRTLYADKYVTIQPAEDVKDPLKNVSIERIHLGARVGQLVNREKPGTGKFDAYLRVKNVKIPDGVYVHGYNHVDIDGCLVERIGPWTGSAKNIEKFAVVFGNGEDLTAQNCEITRTGGGAIIAGKKNRILNCTIHDITHDGIRCVSSKDSIVEGCKIYNLDDGVDDSDPRGKGWNRHCDAIHIFIPGPGLPGAQNSNLTIRGNLMYNCESQAMQFNNYLRVKDIWNENVIIENNVFGPTRANVVNIADPVDGIIFRHNTYLYFPEGQTFQGLGRKIECKNHTFRITPKCKKAQVYNNILVNSPSPQPGWFVGYNVVLGKRSLPTRFDKTNVEPKFVKVDDYDGKLAADSPAVNAGTALFSPTPLHPIDRFGTKRDARPDCGAYELPGQNPESEKPAPKSTLPITTYIDNFKDGNLDVDIWLAGKNQAGLSWTAPKGQPAWRVKHYDDSDNLMSPLGQKGLSWMLTNEGKDWADVTVHLENRNAFNALGAGVLLRANEDLEGYEVNLVTGQVTRRKKNSEGKMEETPVGKSAGMLLPRRLGRKFIITIKDTPKGPKITVDANADGKIELTAVDEDENPIPAGRLGVFSNSKNGSHRTDVSNVKVTVQKRVAPTTPPKK